MKRILVVFTVLLACLSNLSVSPRGTDASPAPRMAQGREPHPAVSAPVPATAEASAGGRLLLDFVCCIGGQAWLCSFGALAPRPLLEARGDGFVLAVDFWTPIGRIQPRRFPGGLSRLPGGRLGRPGAAGDLDMSP